jgi:hypothetical protein
MGSLMRSSGKAAMKGVLFLKITRLLSYSFAVSSLINTNHNNNLN